VVSIYKCSRLWYKTGWRITPSFALQLHKKDLPLLKKKIQAFLGVGTIYESQDGIVLYQVRTLTDLKKIINHFNKYPALFFYLPPFSPLICGGGKRRGAKK
jgi:hypothetical protein